MKDDGAGEHYSPVYLRNVSNFKASLRRRDSQRLLKRDFKVIVPEGLSNFTCGLAAVSFCKPLSISGPSHNHSATVG